MSESDIEPYDEDTHSAATKTLRRFGRQLEHYADLAYIAENDDAKAAMDDAIDDIKRAIEALGDWD